MTIAGIFMPWWGKAPGWERQYLQRAAALQRLVIILVGDAAKFAPEFDLPRIPCTMDEFEARASAVSGVSVRKSDPRYMREQRICELRPLMADVFPEAIAPYSWWGWGDWDVVLGDWDSYLTDERLSQYDMISSASYTVNGTLQFVRNDPRLTQLYRKRLDMVLSPNCDFHLDESGMEQIVRSEPWIRGLYPVDLALSDRHETWSRCELRGNKLFRKDRFGNVGDEILIFHFPATDRWPL